jgi:predicted Zn-dependent protease
MRRLFDIAALVLTVGAIWYVWHTHPQQTATLMREVESHIAPCSTPLTYSIGTIDPQFGISKDILVQDLAQAETLWEKPANKNLYQYQSSGGEVTVNLIYDNRQAVTNRLAADGIAVSSDRSGYDALKARFDTLKAQVTEEQADYTAQVDSYTRQQAAYNAAVKQSNEKGGASSAEYTQLQQEKSGLQTIYTALQATETKLNSDIDMLNTLAAALNDLIKQLNLNIQQYNQTGAAGGTFEEGLYQVSNSIATIDIYEYSNHAQLIRVLAHEMGHALGMDHVENTQSIMYKINTSSSLSASMQDIAELNRVCKLSLQTK